MKKITCTLPNASEEISGVKFAKVDNAAVAEGVDDAVAAQFDGITGYTVEDDAGTGQKAPTKAELKAAKAEADAKAAAEADAAAKSAAPNKEGAK
jgi:hypothetical protein